MGLSRRWWAFWGPLLISPAIALVVLLKVPSWDHSFGTNNFHFYIVSGVTLAAAVAFGVVVSLIQSMKETRLLFLGLAFMCIASVFAVHGLMTPGHIHSEAHAELSVSSWLSVLTGRHLRRLERRDAPRPWSKTWSSATACPSSVSSPWRLGVYMGLAIASPDWLSWVPYDLREVQLGVTALHDVAAALRRISIPPGVSFRATAQPVGHGLRRCPAGGGTGLNDLRAATGRQLVALPRPVRFGLRDAVRRLGDEVRRAGNIRVIADALAMRDAVTQLNHGHAQPIAELVDAIEWKDLYTLGHVPRVASFAVMIGKEMGLSTTGATPPCPRCPDARRRQDWRAGPHPDEAEQAHGRGVRRHQAARDARLRHCPQRQSPGTRCRSDLPAPRTRRWFRLPPRPRRGEHPDCMRALCPSQTPTMQ